MERTYLDIKGAFNKVSPLAIYNCLLQLRAHAKIINFVSFLSDYRICGVVDPQGEGGILSPLLFNIVLGGIESIIPHDIKWFMFATLHSTLRLKV